MKAKEKKKQLGRTGVLSVEHEPYQDVICISSSDGEIYLDPEEWKELSVFVNDLKRQKLFLDA